MNQPEFMQSAFRSVCSIKGTFKEDGVTYQGQGQGAFVAPGVMVTSWHVLSGLKDIIVTDWQGKTAGISKRVKHKKSEALDIAYVTLNTPEIGDDFLDWPSTSNFNPSQNNFMRSEAIVLTRHWGGKAKGFKATFPLLDETSDIISFHSDSYVSEPGCSGSPIIHPKTGRLISIHRGIIPSDVEKNRELSQLFKRIGTNINDNFDRPFRAPNPYKVAEFFKKVLK